jgi:hypothetical protein
LEGFEGLERFGWFDRFGRLGGFETFIELTEPAS